MKEHISVGVTVSNSDLALLMVEGYIEELTREREAIKLSADAKYEDLNETLARVDDKLAEAFEPTLKTIRIGLDAIQELYGKNPINIHTTWRQLQKSWGYKDSTLFGFDKVSKRKVTADNMTFHWLCAMYGFSYPSDMDCFGMFRPRGEGKCLPWPMVGSNVHRDIDKKEDIFPEEVDALMILAKTQAGAYEKLREQLSEITSKIRDREAIERQVAARLTKKALGQMGNLDFVGSLMGSISKPLQLTKED